VTLDVHYDHSIKAHFSTPEQGSSHKRHSCSMCGLHISHASWRVTGCLAPAQLCDRCYAAGLWPRHVGGGNGTPAPPAQNVLGSRTQPKQFASNAGSSMVEVIRRSSQVFRAWWVRHRREGRLVRYVSLLWCAPSGIATVVDGVWAALSPLVCVCVCVCVRVCVCVCVGMATVCNCCTWRASSCCV